MAVNLGSSNISAVKLGATDVSKIYLGSDIVFGGAAPYVPFLENLTASPDFAWSVWQPHSSVTNCVRLRRSSDFAELDFGYVNGYVDTSSITSWGGADTLYIVTFYSYLTDATELTIENQAIWKNSGGLNNLAGFDRAPLSPANTQCYSLDANVTTINDYTLFFGENKLGTTPSNTNYIFSTTLRARGYLYNPGSSIGSRPNTGVVIGVNFLGENVIELNRLSNDISYYQNNSYVDQGVNSDTTSIRYLFGSTEDNPPLVSELLFFKSSLSTADRSQYYTDYNSRYNKTV